MKIKSFFWIAAAASLLSACGSKQEEKVELPKYDLVTLKAESRAITYSFPAILEGDGDVDLYPQVQGRIIGRHYVAGSQVEKGQALVEIDPTPYRLRVESDEANVKAAEAALSSAKLQYESQKKLFEKKIVSDYVMKTAENNFLAAQAQLAQAKAALNNSRTDLNHCTVKAPMSGTVKGDQDATGLLATPSTHLLKIINQRDIRAVFSLTEDMFNQMAREDGVQTTKDGLKSTKGKEFGERYPSIQLVTKDGYTYDKNGTFFSIEAMVDNATGTVTCKVKFPNPDFVLHAGSSASVVFPDSLNNVLVIPQTACKRLQDKYLVFKVNQNNEAEGVLVDVVPTNDGKEYIVSGGALKAGDEIVGSGIARIQEGQRLK